MTARCYVCGSPELAADADLRSPTCHACTPARDHVVSMQTGSSGSTLAVCPCGWRSEVSVRMHWRDMIRWASANRLAFAALFVAVPTIAGNVAVACGWSL